VHHFVGGRHCGELHFAIFTGCSAESFVSQVVAVTADFLVGSIDGLTESGRISKEFVGVILLPIVGNAAGGSNRVR
jgi:Ca2+:H+ antiporter